MKLEEDVTEVMPGPVFPEPSSWPVVPQPWGLLLMAEGPDGSLGARRAWGMWTPWSMPQGNRMKGDWAFYAV